MLGTAAAIVFSVAAAKGISYLSDYLAGGKTATLEQDIGQLVEEKIDSNTAE